jgi:hypothetical protein
MADLVDRIRAELQVRIRELRSVVREFERLERAAAALSRARTRSRFRRCARASVGRRPGLMTTMRRPRPAKRARRPPSVHPAKPQRRRRPVPRAQAGRKSAAPRRTPAPRGHTRAKVLEALAAGLGSGSAAVAKAAGISPSVAAATISRHVKQGQARRLDESYAVTEAPTDDRPTAAEEARSDTGAGSKSSSVESPLEPAPQRPSSGAAVTGRSRQPSLAAPTRTATAPSLYSEGCNGTAKPSKESTRRTLPLAASRTASPAPATSAPTEASPSTSNINASGTLSPITTPRTAYSGRASPVSAGRARQGHERRPCARAWQARVPRSCLTYRHGAPPMRMGNQSPNDGGPNADEAPLLPCDERVR